MTRKEEWVNTATTLGGSLLGAEIVRRAWGANNKGSLEFALVSAAAAGLGGYLGNLIYNTPDDRTYKNLLVDKALPKLIHAGIPIHDASEALQQKTSDIHAGSPGFLRNTGNVIATRIASVIGGHAGLFVTTALCTTLGKGLDMALGTGNKIATYGFVAGTIAGPVIGALGGGYLGNKMWAKPSSKKIEIESTDIVKKILAERSAPPAQSHADTLSWQRSQSHGGKERI